MAIAGTRAPAGSEGRYLAVATAGLTVALFTGVPLGSWAGHTWGWRSTFLLIALVSVVVTALRTHDAPRAGQRPDTTEGSAAPRPQLAGPVARAGDVPLRRRRTHLLQLPRRHRRGAPRIEHERRHLDPPDGRNRRHRRRLRRRSTGRRPRTQGGPSPHRRRSRHRTAGHRSLPRGRWRFRRPFLLLVAAWSLFAWALGPAMQASIIGVDPSSAVLSAALGISGLYGGAGVGAALGGVLIYHLGAVALPWPEAPGGRRMVAVRTARDCVRTAPDGGMTDWRTTLTERLRLREPPSTTTAPGGACLFSERPLPAETVALIADR
ncbi:Purine efflux pump PbuE [Kytococcus sedentarius]|nr:Purine efflux pump PbuE [Kytococcus sedentarius]